MKELSIKGIQVDSESIICELYHVNTGYIKSVASQSDGYIYATSILKHNEDIDA